MDGLQDNELKRIKELLQRTGEFIAYFELAETKMIGWREDINQQTSRLEHYLHTLEDELTQINAFFSEAGIARFRLTAEKALAQGEINLHIIERQCNLFAQNFEAAQEKLNSLTQQCTIKIAQQAENTVQFITGQLSKYDAHQFHRIASESCDHVERVASHAVNKSTKLLGVFQLRFGFFSALITLLTAFIVVLYLSDELPWEMHQHAMNERRAGKVLLQAWPNLTQEEKAKILNDDTLHDS